MLIKTSDEIKVHIVPSNLSLRLLSAKPNLLQPHPPPPAPALLLRLTQPTISQRYKGRNSASSLLHSALEIGGIRRSQNLKICYVISQQKQCYEASRRNFYATISWVGV
jgi:hypothetical protein